MPGVPKSVPDQNDQLPEIDPDGLGHQRNRGNCERAAQIGEDAGPNMAQPVDKRSAGGAGHDHCQRFNCRGQTGAGRAAGGGQNKPRYSQQGEVTARQRNGIGRKQRNEWTPGPGGSPGVHSVRRGHGHATRPSNGTSVNRFSPRSDTRDQPGPAIPDRSPC